MSDKVTFAERVIGFNSSLNYSGQLPEGFRVLNPFLDNPETVQVMKQFYRKYYNDNNNRKFIIGINPGRQGAGVTGVPFTDTKRLESVCEIKMHSEYTHEVSSVFVYDMIEQYGGAKAFYRDFYINSPFPLAIVRKTKDDKWLNANYYDDNYLFECVKDYMSDILVQHVATGLNTDEVFVLGKKNAVYVNRLNKKLNLFKKISILEHPRYIQQYKSKEKELYISKYLTYFSGADNET